LKSLRQLSTAAHTALALGSATGGGQARGQFHHIRMFNFVSIKDSGTKIHHARLLIAGLFYHQYSKKSNRLLEFVY
jgi:hypothetical protein